TLGAIAVGDPRHVAEITRIPRPPDGAEEVPAMLSRLLEAHEQIIEEARELAQRADELGDLVTNDILVSDVLRTNELQVWFIAENRVDRPLVVVWADRWWPGACAPGHRPPPQRAAATARAARPGPTHPRPRTLPERICPRYETCEGAATV